MSAGTLTRPNSNPILDMMRDADMGDPWGTAMSWGFAVAEVLCDADPSEVPSVLGYRPGMGGPDVPFMSHDGEEMAYHPEHVDWETNQVWDYLHQSHAEAPIYWDDPTFEGRVRELVTAALCLNRYLDWCRAAGLDY